MLSLRPLVVLLPLIAAACASAPVTGRPPIPPGVPPQFLHFSDAVVARGQMAPDFTLPTPSGGFTTTLSNLRGKPVVLVFGSHTCNLFRRDIPALRKLYDETVGEARFLLVYVREAHPNDEWVMPDNEARGLSIRQPLTAEERATAARECTGDFALAMPTVVDGLDDAVCKTYGGWPDRLYVIAPDGRIAYQGGVGPFGFKPDEVREFLRKEYGF